MRVPVSMAVMLVMTVPMLVLQFFVDMLMIMQLREVQPMTEPHRGSGDLQLHCQRLAEHEDGERCSHKGR